MSLFIICINIFIVIFAITAIVNIRCNRSGLPTTVSKPVSRKKFRIDMKVKLNILSIIRWEQLRGKSFSLMNYSDKDDIDSLLYTTTICNEEDKLYTFEVFRHILSNEKITCELIQNLERETAILSQFQKKHSNSDMSDKEGTPDMIGELISALIMSGLDAHYALKEMKLCDLPLYIDAYERTKKEQMESDRLWTFLTILPHVDSKKLPSARDLYLFPWEEEEVKKNAERAIKENEADLKKFLSGEMFDIDSVNWTKRE